MTSFPGTIGIVGLGQIGGSIGLGLRKRAPELRLVGVDIRKARAEEARSFLDATSTSIDVLQDADWIILAVPVRTILYLMENLFGRFPGTTFLDTGSTKQEIVARAEVLGQDFHFVGGHPLAGSEKAGEAGWNADLFQGRPFFLTRVLVNSPLNEIAEQLVVLLGARPVWVDPEIHDRLLSYSSHFAYLLSALYLLQGASGDKLRPDFLGSGFESMARLAGSSSEMGMDMLLSNREYVLDELRSFKKALETVETWLEKNKTEELKKWLRLSEFTWKEISSGD